jgi:drug/metabolite transporter (DMT)-like permease
MKIMNINQGYLYVSLASILWASTAAVSKLLLAHLDNLQVLFFSTLFASLSLMVISLAQGEFAVLKTYSLMDYVIFAAMGFIGVFLYRFFLQAALVLMPAQEAFIVNYTWPIMVVIFAWIILKEKMNLKKVIGLLLSFIGVVIVTTKGDFSALNFSVGGVFFALAGAVAYGFYSVLGKRQTYEKYTSTTFFYIFSFIFSAISLFLFSSIPSLSLEQLGGLLWLGIFPSGLAFVFWLIALKHGDTAKISNLIFMTPFLSLIYIYFLLGEKILLSSIIGLAVIVAGILMQSINGKNLPPKGKISKILL